MNSMSLRPFGKNTYATVTATLWATKPRFPADVEWKVWISENNGAWTEVPPRAADPNGFEVLGETADWIVLRHLPWNDRAVPRNGIHLQPISSYRYRVEAVYTPSGWNGGTQERTTSNMRGPTLSEPQPATDVILDDLGW